MEYKYDREYWNEVNGLVWKQVKRCGLTLARTALVLLVFATTLPWQLYYYMHDRWLDYTLEDTNGNRKLLKQRYDQKIDAVAAMMDAYVAYKNNRDAFE